ncbi:MAG: (2Fe-2S)-binding protein [Pirellulaceae bacterium]
MELDDEICLCFHVTKRKVVNYIRIHQPQVAGQLSECFGAGTGCGWCRPFLQRLMETSDSDATDNLSTEDYARQRTAYRAKKQDK